MGRKKQVKVQIFLWSQATFPTNFAGTPNQIRIPAIRHLQV
jgi:hypothetical protein